MIEPFGRRIYILPDEEIGIIQSGESRKIVQGRVVEVGDKVEKIRPGDTVIFTAWGVDEITIKGVTHYFLLETDEFILARIKLSSGVVSPLQSLEAEPSSTGRSMPKVSQTSIL